MKRKQVWTWGLIVLALVAGLVAWGRPALRLQAEAVPGAEYTLDWWTVDGGGLTAPASSGYTLEGTIGQPDAAQWAGGGYTLEGGFWVPSESVSPPQWWVYLPLVAK